MGSRTHGQRTLKRTVSRRRKPENLIGGLFKYLAGKISAAALLDGPMPKTFSNLYRQIYDFEALHRAYMLARKGKRSRHEIRRFEQNLEGELIQLQNELIWGMYRTGRYRHFKVYEPKEREVAALPFRDRVLQHALVAVIEPIWEPRFIDQSYACRPGKGTHAGADKAQEMMRQVKREHGQVYVFKADIRKFFYSIDHQILKRIVRKKISCKQTLWLIDSIIDSSSAPEDTRPAGLPIGNLTSQLMANVYMNELDNFVKHELREAKYIRYMDDFIVVHHDKRHLRLVRQKVEEFLWQTLRLTTNAKTQIFPVSVSRGRALDFLGYRIWLTHRRLRKSSISRITRSLRRLQVRYAEGRIGLYPISQSIKSWLAHAEHADTYGLRLHILRSYPFSRALPV